MAVGEFATQLPVGGVRPIITDGSASRVRYAGNFTHTYGPLNLQFGGTLEQQHYEYHAWPQTATRDSLLLRSTANGDIAGFYLDGQVQPVKRLMLRTGLRADVFSIDGVPRIAPRIAVTLLLTDKASLTVAAGQYRQYVRAQSGSGIVGTPVVDSASQHSLAIAKASHLVVTLDQDLGDAVRLAVEGYYKSFDGLPSTNGELTEASGLDLWVRRAGGRFTGWLGYSLAWVWSREGIADATTNRFAGRQLLSAGVGGPFAANGRFDLRLAYGAGCLRAFDFFSHPFISPDFTQGYA